MDSQANSNPRIGVVGGGSWGTALANLLALKGYPVQWWIYESDLVRHIREKRENSVFLPGVQLPDVLHPSDDLSAVVHQKDLVVIVVPSHVMRSVTGEMADHLKMDAIVVSASKGIENDTLLTMSGVIRETIGHIGPDRFAALSGPSFAVEVARGVPTVVTVASEDLDCAQKVQHIFATPSFRVYTNDDIIGVELGGAVKNVIAIAAGMVDGLGLGLNTRAALITRGLVEITRLGKAMGANPHTLVGSAGLGDLVLTCTGDLSRNHTVGKKIGQGTKLKDVLSDMRMVAEGVKTARSVYSLSLRMNVEMPISQAVYRILYEDLAPREAVHLLMTRDLKNELDDN
ncbi:MAG: NAD(P)-dependent glycerol-3-phosphate dehydrogenase [Desulfobacteraceae bacterium]|nr:MAG: NAD(P)-dependent glycerol-3-phosphate dehydrogenase [Desulfobacteraceae bacterium]